MEHVCVACGDGGFVAVSSSSSVHFCRVVGSDFFPIRSWRFPEPLTVKLLLWSGSDLLILSHDNIVSCVRTEMFRSQEDDESRCILDIFDGQLRVKHLAASVNHLIVASDMGDVYDFGSGVDDVLRFSGLPHPLMMGQNLGVVATTSKFALAANDGGVVFSWFWKDAHSYRRIHFGTAIKKVACCSSYVICLSDEGAVFTSGVGKHGVLGHGGYADEKTPRQVIALGGEDVVDIHASSRFAMALTAEGKAYAWGSVNDVVVTYPKEMNSLGGSIQGVDCCSHFGVVVTGSGDVRLISHEAMELESLPLLSDALRCGDSSPLFSSMIARVLQEKTPSPKHSNSSGKQSTRRRKSPGRERSKKKKTEPSSPKEAEVHSKFDQLHGEIVELRNLIQQINVQGPQSHEEKEKKDDDEEKITKERLLDEKEGVIRALTTEASKWMSEYEKVCSASSREVAKLRSVIEDREDTVEELHGELSVWKQRFEDRISVLSHVLMEVRRWEESASSEKLRADRVTSQGNAMRNRLSELESLPKQMELLQAQLTTKSRIISEQNERLEVWMQEVRELEEQSTQLLKAKSDEIDRLKGIVSKMMEGDSDMSYEFQPVQSSSTS